MDRPHHHRVRSRFSWLGVLLLTAGCATATNSAPLNWEGNPKSVDDHIFVVVENQLWNDVVVHSVASGVPVRLGIATTGIPKRMRIPAHHRFVRDLELVADPIGSARVRRSGAVAAVPGQVIRWRIEQTEGISQLTIR